MSLDGPGSDLDLLIRMRPGGDLYGTWVLFDVTWRVTKNEWKTFAVHVYDHNLRALATIFICELKGENHKCLEAAWRCMIDVIKENGEEPVTPYGFMADMAEVEWIVVRNVFWGGKANPEKIKASSTDIFIYIVKHPHFAVPEPDIAGPAKPEFEVPEEPYFAVPAEPEFEVPEALYFADPADPEIAVLEEPYIANPDELEVVVGSYSKEEAKHEGIHDSAA
ncbi:hypothetical protein R1sor_013833 [Riccia sorocarpa]|uniref:Uncharacterized protein n=1 Tax=Riccia sorocarpa TaxID=122646 RepID=A0ABD3HAL1_9MARC